MKYILIDKKQNIAIKFDSLKDIHIWLLGYYFVGVLNAINNVKLTEKSDDWEVNYQIGDRWSKSNKWLIIKETENVS